MIPGTRPRASFGWLLPYKYYAPDYPSKRLLHFDAEWAPMKSGRLSVGRRVDETCAVNRF